MSMNSNQHMLHGNNNKKMNIHSNRQPTGCVLTDLVWLSNRNQFRCIRLRRRHNKLELNVLIWRFHAKPILGRVSFECNWRHHRRATDVPEHHHSLPNASGSSGFKDDPKKRSEYTNPRGMELQMHFFLLFAFLFLPELSMRVFGLVNIWPVGAAYSNEDIQGLARNPTNSHNVLNS